MIAKRTDRPEFPQYTDRLPLGAEGLSVSPALRGAGEDRGNRTDRVVSLLAACSNIEPEWDDVLLTSTPPHGQYKSPVLKLRSAASVIGLRISQAPSTERQIS